MSTAEALTPLPTLVHDEFDNHDHYEIVDGVEVELPPMSVDSQVLGSRLTVLLSTFGSVQNIGEAYAEVMFELPLKKDRKRRPDVAFVSYAKWPKYKPMPATNAWNVLPDVCVEVVSPNDKGDEIETKIDEYIRSKIPLIWLIYPRQAVVYVYESQQIRRLTAADTLDGGAVVPGFALPLSELFPQPPAAPPAQP